MPITHDGSAPYTAPQAVLGFLQRYRSTGLTTPISPDVLEKAGVQPTLLNRTLLSLKLLELIDEEGEPAPVLVELRKASATDYKPRLAEHLRHVYQDVFKYLDPQTATAEQIRDAFRHYEPIGQQGRMVTLFTNLCAEAGLMPAIPKAPKGSQMKLAPRKPAPSPKRQPENHWQSFAGRIADGLKSGVIPDPILGLLKTLPPEGAPWPDERRKAFFTALQGITEYVYPLREAEPSDESEEE